MNDTNKAWQDAFTRSIKDLQYRFTEQEQRIQQLEKLVHYPNTTKANINCAPPEHLYAPLRNDTKAVLDLAAFARRLLDPQDLGHAVSFEVREAAREALGLKKVES